MFRDSSREEKTTTAFMVRITVLQGRAAGKIQDVRFFPAVIGRGSEVDVPLVDDPQISRQHVRIRLKGGYIMLEDVSSNGTWVEDKLIGPERPVLLGDDAEVQLGPHTVVRLQVMPDFAQAARGAQPAPATGGGWLKSLIRPKKTETHVVELRSFGRYTLTVDGAKPVDIPWEQRNAALLLVYLADNGQPVPGESLAVVLFPDAIDGRQALQTVLNRLRKAFGTVGLPNLVRQEGKAFALDPSCSIWFDVAEFELWVREAQRRFEEPNLEAAAQALEGALDLYRGPFLEGFNEDWVAHRREQLEHSWLEAWEMMGAIRMQEERPEEAVRVYESVLEMSPARLQAHLGLIRSLAALGRTEDAATQCNESLKYFETELGELSNPELEALFSELTGT